MTVLLNPGFYLLSEFGNVEKTHFAETGMVMYFVEKKVGQQRLIFSFLWYELIYGLKWHILQA